MQYIVLCFCFLIFSCTKEERTTPEPEVKDETILIVSIGGEICPINSYNKFKSLIYRPAIRLTENTTPPDCQSLEKYNLSLHHHFFIEAILERIKNLGQIQLVPIIIDKNTQVDQIEKLIKKIGPHFSLNSNLYFHESDNAKGPLPFDLSVSINSTSPFKNDHYYFEDSNSAFALKGKDLALAEGLASSINLCPNEIQKRDYDQYLKCLKKHGKMNKRGLPTLPLF